MRSLRIRLSKVSGSLQPGRAIAVRNLPPKLIESHVKEGELGVRRSSYSVGHVHISMQSNVEMFVRRLLKDRTSRNALASTKCKFQFRLTLLYAWARSFDDNSAQSSKMPFESLKKDNSQNSSSFIATLLELRPSYTSMPKINTRERVAVSPVSSCAGLDCPGV